jgi:hypothetical protein
VTIDVNKQLAKLQEQGLEVFNRVSFEGKHTYFVEGYELRAEDLVELDRCGKLDLVGIRELKAKGE